jgi:hypothetical protein
MNLHQPSLKDQFSLFFAQNQPNNMEEAIENFAIFGAYQKKVDTSLPLIESIKNIILKNYKYIRTQVNNSTNGNAQAHRLLTAFALGDTRIHSAYKNAKLSDEEGDIILDALLKSNLVFELNAINSFKKTAKISNKIYFNSPFMHFWFAYVSPLYKGIKDGDYKEIEEKFNNRKTEHIDHIFKQLSLSLLEYLYSKDDPIIKITPYWDNDIYFDILAKTKSGKTILGTAKYTNQKMKKTELNQLKEKALSLKLKVDIFVLLSKKGFSNELKNLKSDTIKLYSSKHFKELLKK